MAKGTGSISSKMVVRVSVVTIAVGVGIFLFVGAGTSKDGTKAKGGRKGVAAATVPGTLGESAQVDPNGAFDFDVPIVVPPGIAGMQPKLSLAYSNQQSNGIVGVGWALEGLPSVARTKRIRAIDGVNGTVAYDANDRYALQGRRLIATKGAYGQDGTLYQTEIESWQQLTSHGTAGSGPLYFTARKKDGSTIELGNSPDSRSVAAGHPDVRVWRVNRATDRNGNSMTVAYTSDPLNSGKSDYRAYPLQISYTANASQQANRFVRFLYEARPDTETIFIGGSAVVTSARLSHVQTFVGATLVSDYRLAYETSKTTIRSRLVSAARFPSASPGGSSLPPAQFSYTDSNLAFGGKQTWLAGAFSRQQGWNPTTDPVTLSDVNGDGFLDIVGFSHSSGVQVALGGAKGMAGPTKWISDFDSSSGTRWASRFLADINGDGFGDIVGISGQGVETALSSGSAFTKQAGVFPYFGSTQGWTEKMPVMMVDVNGDNRMDLVGVKNAAASVALAGKDGVFTAPTAWVQSFGHPGDQYLSADLNGDGNADMVNIDNMHTVNVALSDGKSAFDPSGWQGQGPGRSICGQNPVTPKTQVLIADVNADGLSDAIAFCDDGVYVSQSNGKGFQPAGVWNTTFAGGNWSVSNLRMMADLNGDGLADLVGVTTNGVIAALCDGHSFKDNTWNNASLPWGLSGGGSASITMRLMGDANADGMTDMIGIGDTNVYVGVSTGNFPDLMVGATRSAGAQYKVTYAPLSDPSAYTEDNRRALAQSLNFQPYDAGAGIANYRSAGRLGGFYHVVKQWTLTDNPAIHDGAFSYSHAMHYHNGAVDLNGRGWLGFATVTSDNPNTSIRTVSAYRQDFPFIGKESGSTVYDGSQPTICSGNPQPYSGTATAYDKRQTGQSTGAGAAPVYFVYKTSAQTLAYQNCAVANIIGTTYGYDAYGNRTLVTHQNLVDATGKPMDPSKVVYTLATYSNDTNRWLLGLPLYKKVSLANDPANIQIYTPGRDYSLSKLSYDTNGNVLTRGGWDAANNRYLATVYTYDGFGNRLTARPPSGTTRTTTYEKTYNTYPASKTVTTTTKGSLTWTYGYDPRFGKRSTVTDPNGVPKVTCFDGFGRTVAMQGPYPDNRKTGTFDPACASSLVTAQPVPGNVVTVQQTGYQWDGQSPAVTTTKLAAWPSQGARKTAQVTQVRDGLWRKHKVVTTNPDEPQDVLALVTYSEGGKVLTAALPHFAGDPVQTVTNTYDVLGRPTTTTMPFGQPGTNVTTVARKSYTATPSGVDVVQTSAAGAPNAVTQQLSYGTAAGKSRLTTVSLQGVPGVTNFGYDLLGRRISMKGPPGQDGSRPTYTTTYDSLGRVKVATQPARGTTTYAYDPTGTRATTQTALGLFKHHYDLLGRRTDTTDPDGRKQIFTYDDPSSPFGLGRRTSTQTLDAAGSLLTKKGHGFDAYGARALLALDAQVAGLSRSYRTHLGYDPMGRLTAVVNPDKSAVTRTFSGQRLTGVSLGNGGSAVFSKFSAAGTPGQVVYGNRASAVYVLNVDQSPHQITVLDPQEKVLLSRQFNWDAHGRLDSIVDSGAHPPATLRQNKYLGLRLASVTGADGSNPWVFGYDDSGNMTSYEGAAYVYRGTLATSAGGAKGFTATYDAMGDMKTLTPAGGETLQFMFDTRNQLVAAKKTRDPGGSSYQYDGDGRRVAAAMPDGSASVYVSAWYVDTIVRGNASPIRVLRAFGRPFAQWGTAAGDQSQFYLHTDHQRSVVLTTGGAGTALAQLSYSPFGALQSGGGSAARFLFTGKELDPYIGFYWMGSRAFNPLTGRFNKADDQLGATATRQDALNDNAYVLNNAVSYLDPTGHTTLGLAGVGVCVAISGGLSAAAGSQAADAAKAKALGIPAGVVAGVCGVLGIVDAGVKYRARITDFASDLWDTYGPGGPPNAGGMDGGNIDIVNDVGDAGVDDNIVSGSDNLIIDDGPIIVEDLFPVNGGNGVGDVGASKSLPKGGGNNGDDSDSDSYSTTEDSPTASNSNSASYSKSSSYSSSGDSTGSKTSSTSTSPDQSSVTGSNSSNTGKVATNSETGTNSSVTTSTGESADQLNNDLGAANVGQNVAEVANTAENAAVDTLEIVAELVVDLLI